MSKGIKYDQMVDNPQNDELGFFDGYQENMAFFQAFIRSLNPMKIYDLGCGTGNLSGPLSDIFSVIGIDRSSEMLEQAKLKYPLMEVENSDILSWCDVHKSHQNDLIVSSFVLHALEDKSRVFELFADAVQSGGKVIVVDYLFKSVAHIKEFADALSSQGKSELADVIWRKFFLTTDEVELWAEKCNLHVEIIMRNRWVGMLIIKSKEKGDI